MNYAAAAAAAAAMFQVLMTHNYMKNRKVT
jgi:hypothetical protein